LLEAIILTTEPALLFANVYLGFVCQFSTYIQHTCSDFAEGLLPCQFGLRFDDLYLVHTVAELRIGILRYLSLLVFFGILQVIGYMLYNIIRPGPLHYNEWSCVRRQVVAHSPGASGHVMCNLTIRQFRRSALIIRMGMRRTCRTRGDSSRLLDSNRRAGRRACIHIAKSFGLAVSSSCFEPYETLPRPLSYALLTLNPDRSSLSPSASYRRPLELRSFVVQLTPDDLMLGSEVRLVK
jgi:hypothetical protein